MNRREFLRGALVIGAATTASPLIAACESGQNGPIAQEGTPSTSSTPGTAPAAPSPAANPFAEAYKGVALSNTLLYAPNQDQVPISPEDVDKRLHLAIDIGARAIRFGVDATVLWADKADFEANRITWDPYDLLINRADKFGLLCLANFVGWPTPLGIPECSDSFSCFPQGKYREKYAGLVHKFVEQYPQITMYQWWNEQNSIAANGGTQQNPKYFADPALYAEFFNFNRAVIIDANPNAAVAVGALSGLNSNGAIDPTDFIKLSIEAGMEGFKALSINSYGNTVEYIKGNTNQRTLAADLSDEALNKKIPGLKKTPVLITEFGAEAATTAQYPDQSEAVRQGLATNFGNLVTSRYVYTLVDNGDDFYGLYTSDLKAKPAAKIFRDTPLGS